MTGAVFLDTGIFLSFLARDHEKRFLEARRLFEQAEAGHARLETTEVVLAEVARTLETKYHMPRGTVVEVMEAVMGTRNLRIPARKVLKRAIEIFAGGDLDFIEAYNEAYVSQRGLKRPGAFAGAGKPERGAGTA